MSWLKASILGLLAWDKLLRHLTLLDGSKSIKGFVKIVVDDEAHGHDILVVDLTDHRDQLGLELGERAEQVAQSLTLLARLSLINDLIREIDVAFDKVHVFNQFFKLLRHRLC